MERAAMKAMVSCEKLFSKKVDFSFCGNLANTCRNIISELHYFYILAGLSELVVSFFYAHVFILKSHLTV